MRSPLFRVTSLNGVSVIVKIAIGFVTSKVVAIFVGPAGMALVGNLRNFLTSAEGIATLGFQNGIVKYIAEAKQDESALKKVLSTIFISLAAVTIVSSLLLFGLSNYWSASVFSGNEDFGKVFRIMALAFPFYCASIFIVSVLNGLEKYRQVIWANIIGNVLGLAVSVILIYRYELFGAMLAIVLAPTTLFFVSLVYIGREINLLQNISFASFDKTTLKNLGSYSLMTLFSAVFVPVVYLAIRQKAIAVSGIDAAGHWEAINRISTYYMLFISTLLTVYFLPKLVLSQTESEMKSVVKSYSKGILPLFFIALVILYLLRDFAINLLFTPDFVETRELFLWQLAGDFLKAASLILACIFFASRLTVAFIVSEVLSLAILYVSSVFFLSVMGIKGLTVAHFVTYAFYFVGLVFYFRKIIFRRSF
ncbi:MAG: O-antigen translocase [Flavobacterium sp.]|nr:MAG: O-antigen translocase [Flavobacterium sp.]